VPQAKVSASRARFRHPARVWWLSCRCPMVVVAQMCGESVVLR